MATSQAIDSRVFDDILPQIRQYEATTGRSISPGALESLLRAQYRSQAERSLQYAQLGERKREFDIQQEAQEKQRKKEAAAARTSGAIQLGGTALQTAILGKAGYLGTTVQGALGGPIGGPAVSTTPFVPTAVPHTTLSTSLGSSTITGAGVQGASTTGSQVVAGELLAAQPAVNVPGAAATSGGATALAPAAPPIIAPAVAGFGIGAVSQKIFPGRGPRTRAGVGGGAVAGAAIGAPAGPVGMVVGAIIGGVSGYAGANK